MGFGELCKSYGIRNAIFQGPESFGKKEFSKQLYKKFLDFCLEEF